MAVKLTMFALLLYSLTVEAMVIDSTETSQVMLQYPLDLAFIMDATGSMTSYINEVKQNIHKIVDQIVVSSQSDVRLALIAYRDHSPQERSFVTRVNDFTDSVSTMKSWLMKTKARGGGDAPEAVADALDEARKLTWRAEAMKISILISDAPPHGLHPMKDRSFPHGCPSEHDPMRSVRELAKIGITLYSVGCEPSILPYKDFFEALAFLTGGQYVPMSDPRTLIDVIIGGAQEELSLKQFSSEVKQEVERVIARGKQVDEQQITIAVYNRLNKQGAKSKHLMKNNKVLVGPSDKAKLVAKKLSMADVRKTLKFPGRNSNRFRDRMSLRRKGSRHGHMRRYRPSLSRSRYSRLRGRPGMESARVAPKLSVAVRPSLSRSKLRVRPAMESARVSPKLSVADRPLFAHITKSDSTSRVSRTREGFTTVESGISMDQIARMVKKETSKI